MPRTATLAAVLTAWTAVSSAQVPELDERFDGAGRAAWTTRLLVPGIPSLAWTATGGEGALRFESRGLGMAARQWPIGAEPFELSADIEIERGLAARWRNNGIVVMLGSAPVDEMAEGDWAVMFAALQQGAVATVVRGGGMMAEEIRPKVWRFPRKDIAPRYQLTMAGGGGEDYSVGWPTQRADGTRLRFHALRDGRGAMRLAIFHSDGAAGPWWEAEAALSDDLAAVPLKWLTIHTTREANHFADLGQEVLEPAQWKGAVRRLRARALADGEKPAFREPIGAGLLDGPGRPAGEKPFLLPHGGWDELRAKFNDPAWADYRTVVLRNASPEVLDTIGYGVPGQSNRLCAVLWAALLSGRDDMRPVLEEIDALIGPTDSLPAEQSGFPGHMRQLLNIREFMGHNVAELAVAYELLGDRLDEARRGRIRYLLVRAVRNFLDRLEANDWWYANNPSNTVGVANGTMGLAALAIRFDAPELSRAAVDRAVETILARYQAVRPDGACAEGNMYWNYGLAYPLLFGHALRGATGDDRGLLTGEGLRNAHRYIEANLGGDGRLIPFNDTQPWLNGWLVCAHGGAEFDRPLMRWMADHMARRFASGPTFPEQDRSAFAVAAFLFRDGRPAPADFPGVPNLAVLEETNEAVLRSDGREFQPRLVTAVKGMGAVATHHANEDQGSFVLYGGGEMLLLDPGYFEAEAFKHSLPLCGEPEDCRLWAKAPCPVYDAFEAGRFRSVAVDATAAYTTGPNAQDPPVRRAARVFVQAGDQALVILDDLVPVDPAAPLAALFQAAFPVRIEADRAVVAGERTEVHITLHGPDTALDTAPRAFKKDWVYAKRATAWHTLQAGYRFDPHRPLVSVLALSPIGGTPVAPGVDFQPDRIAVRLEGSQSVVFERGGGVWRAARPVDAASATPALGTLTPSRSGRPE